jgi:hypothetical protein
MARAHLAQGDRLVYREKFGARAPSIENPDHAALQRALLESEKVVFDASGFISLRESGWQPQVRARR